MKQSDSFIIRKATKNDLSAIVRMTVALQDHVRSVRPAYKTGTAFRATAEKNTRKYLSSTNNHALIAEHEGKAVGFCLCQIRKPYSVFPEERIGFIYDIYIEPAFRRQRLAGRFLDLQYAWMKKRKVRVVEL